LVCLNVEWWKFCMACYSSTSCVDRPLVQELGNWDASAPTM
jgi:hypothetical protein